MAVFNFKVLTHEEFTKLLVERLESAEDKLSRCPNDLRYTNMVKGINDTAKTFRDIRPYAVAFEDENQALGILEVADEKTKNEIYNDLKKESMTYI